MINLKRQLLSLFAAVCFASAAIAPAPAEAAPITAAPALVSASAAASMPLLSASIAGSVKRSLAHTYNTDVGLGVDVNGRANLTPRAAAKKYYVNPSIGNDTTNDCNAAQSPATPKATTKNAWTCVVDGEGDFVLLAEGQSYSTGFVDMNLKGGYSPQYPVVIESYDPADPTNQAKWGTATGSNRPLVNIQGADSGSGLIASTASQGTTLYHAIRGIEFNSGNVSNNHTSIGRGSTDNRNPDYLLLENDVFAYVQLNLDSNGNSYKGLHYTIRSCVFYGEWSPGSPHVQGVYSDWTSGLTIEDSVFWHNGWKIGASLSDLDTVGGPSIYNHPIYAQADTVNVVVRRNVFIDSPKDSGELKGGGVYQGNLSFNTAFGGQFGASGTATSVLAPFGIYIDNSYNAIIGGVWCTQAKFGMLGSGARIHHNVCANSSASNWGSGSPAGLMADASHDHNDQAGDDAVLKFGLDTYEQFDNNILWNWAGSADQAIGTSTDSFVSQIHATYTNNSWGTTVTGNTLNSSVAWPNNFTQTTLLNQLGYPDIDTARADWVAHPEQHKWERGVGLAEVGYGLTIPALTDLTTNSSLTAGLANTGQFVGEAPDGSVISATGLPPCVTIISNNHAWSNDGTCSAGTYNSTITETNGTRVHNTPITWTIYSAPVLSSVTTTPSPTSVNVAFNTNVGSGKAYYAITSSSTPSTWYCSRAGEDGSCGAYAVKYGSQPITSSGAQTISGIGGLTSGTSYYLQLAQLDANNNPSANTTVAFTAAASGTATLSNPAVTLITSSGANLGIDTDTGSGTLYDEVSTSSTAPSVTQIQAGQNSSGVAAVFATSQAVSTSGTQSTSATGLTASTTYYPYWQQNTTAGNTAVFAGSPFTTTGSTWTPATLGSNLVFDFTHLDSSHLYTDTTCSTPVSADGQLVKCITDTTTGVSAQNGTGWAYSSNSGHPYLTMDGTSLFTTNTTLSHFDASGQWTAWFVGQMTNSAASGGAIRGNTLATNFIILNTSNGRVTSTYRDGTNTATANAATANGTFAASTNYVVMGIATTSAMTVSINNATTVTTPHSLASLYTTAEIIRFGYQLAGRFYGAMMAKGDQSASASNAQGYLGPLHDYLILPMVGPMAFRRRKRKAANDNGTAEAKAA